MSTFPGNDSRDVREIALKHALGRGNMPIEPAAALDTVAIAAHRARHRA